MHNEFTEPEPSKTGEMVLRKWERYSLLSAVGPRNRAPAETVLKRLPIGRSTKFVKQHRRLLRLSAESRHGYNCDPAGLDRPGHSLLRRS